VRFDTHRVSAYLVEELQRARPALEVVDHSGDIIHVRSSSGEQHSLYFIESPITVYEIRSILHANSAAGVSSLFILWGELFIPPHGTRYRPERNDWMSAFLAIHQGKIYAFDPYADQFIFPVYFDHPPAADDFHPAERQIRYGTVFDAARLHTLLVDVRSPLIPGRWRMASFEPAGTHHPHSIRLDLIEHLARLGLATHAPLTREAIKRAYRRRARLLHPDVSAAHDANEQMQMLNRAYRRLLDAIDHEH